MNDIAALIKEAQAKGGEKVRRRIYVASRTLPARCEMWRRLRKEGANIVSSWIDEAGLGQTADLGELWVRIEEEIENSDCLLLYVESEDFPLKGALVEVGMALASSTPILIVAPDCEFVAPSFRPIGSWIKHPLVSFVATIEEAVRS